MFENPEHGEPCSRASDVWAFGVTVWEIYTKSNKIPENFRLRKDIIKNHEDGKRLEQPELMPEYLYRYVILRCFDLTPSNRPSMKEIYDEFEGQIFV